MKNVGGVSFLIPLGSKVMDLNGLVTLNELGSFIWEFLEDECSINDLVVEVVNQFNVEFERAQADILIFLDNISKLGLVEE